MPLLGGTCAPSPSKGFQLEKIRRQPCRHSPGGQNGPGACQDGANGSANGRGSAASITDAPALKAVYLGVTCLFYATSPNTNNTNNAIYLNTNGNVNNNNCTNTNGSRPALMVRPDRVGQKPKAAPSITSKEVTSSLDTKANTLR